MRLSETEERLKVVVGICHHTGELIDRCLKSVRDSFDMGLDIKVVVCTSTERVFEQAVTLKDTGGPAHKRNLIARWYGNDSRYLIFLDDDVEISPYCIWNLVAFMEAKQECAMGFAKILKMDRRDVFDDCGSWLTPTGFLWSRAQDNQLDRGQFDESCQVLASKSATCIVRRDVFEQVGGFDASYYILAEETDLAWRVWLGGGECWYIPQAVSWHAFGTALKPKQAFYTLERIHYRGCANYLNLLATNLGFSRLIWILPVHLSIWIASAGSFLLRGDWRRCGLILKAITSAVWHLPRIWKKRRQVQRTRQRTDRELFRVIYRAPKLSYYTARFVRYVTQGLHG